jgi:hypothetical protein
MVFLHSSMMGVLFFELTVSAVDVNQPGSKVLLLASNTGSHGVFWNPGR